MIIDDYLKLQAEVERRGLGMSEDNLTRLLIAQKLDNIDTRLFDGFDFSDICAKLQLIAEKEV